MNGRSSSLQGGALIRRALASEGDAIRRLVAGVVEEVYGSLLPAGQAAEDDTDWREALVADLAGTIIGVALTSGNTVDDLWVSADHRGRGVGGALLARAESEIRDRGYRSARLRVVTSNKAARRFYETHKWNETNVYPHEQWGFQMVDMTKEFSADLHGTATETSVTVQVTRLPHGAGLPLPEYQTEDAAGCDLLAAVEEENPVVLSPGGRALVPTGIAIALRSGFEAQVRPRSGLAVKFGVTVLNAPGTIDADYRGEIKVPIINHGETPFTITRGMRIAQLVVAPVTRAIFVEVDKLSSTARGSGGFGSTGISE